MLKTSVTLLLSALATSAFADTHISYVDSDGRAAAQIFVKDGKVRIEGGRGIALYDMASNSFTMLMPERKQYLVMNEQSLAQMGASMSATQHQAQAAIAAHQGQMDQANQQMQAAMANMTPEQKAMMQQAMGTHGTPAMPAASSNGPQVEMKDLGSSETVAGHKCEDMQMMVMGQPGATLCLFSGPLSALDIPAADVKTLGAMRDGMLKIQSQMGPMAQGMASMMGKGFSLKTTHPGYGGTPPVTSIFKGVSTAGLDASLFAVPAGYTQTTVQEMMQPPHP